MIDPSCPRCPTCHDTGRVLVGDPPYPDDYEVVDCPDCGGPPKQPSAWSVRIEAYGGGDLDGSPMDEALAKGTYRALRSAGFTAIDLVCRDNAWGGWRPATAAEREEAAGA